MCTPVFIVTPFTTSSAWKQPKYPSTEERIKKTWYICILTATQKSEIIPYALVATWMQLEIILSEISLKEKGKYHMVSLICAKI